MVRLEKEKIVWIALIAIIIFLVWETLKELISPIVFGIAATYIAYPFHIKLSRKLGKKLSVLLLSALLAIFTILFFIGVTLWITDTLRNLYAYLNSFFSWLGSLNVPSFLSSIFDAMATSFPQKLRDILLQYTLSLPKLALQLIVFLAVFYATLSNSDFLAREIYELLPSSNRELGEKLIEKVRDTVDAILKTWLFFSIIKGMFLTIGFYLFEISNVAGSIAAGVLCVILELLPVVGGWIMWLAGAIILWKKSTLLALLFSIYGILTISPVPDYTLKSRFTKGRASVSSVVALVGIFGGLIAFGAVGIILGPIAIGLLLALIDAWKEIKLKQPSKARHSQDA
ncbi:AI-2E family transporter [Pyrococcus abyssi]|uniref:AI-2E family transporter n=1 Tax=Pyrococcus abyssi TaxID=29292 RepID=UPI0018733AD5|nr:AI-2E family transporter [Pyrococcus abyssi]